ncbi:hypothetical protein, conserved [Cyanidioschyzon merolae strain 10D]|uniref:Nudix hydrolase domain-containing protein n=1 Tax=Cyanidioschyzon merolae (strain NIES-3377 / 10D) TaxID=280699 RepID=M1VHV3_CYAM1|nr:hypothetical protein, conserved [Cyanidioschyzon merolae strain 10D]BAM83022.1 hypothetical protein, conserved [Cyanidioschyzon merolae strain 10D]|eukprot:XP_005539058.1 hypothetical protein, conserved [Cyanidioschyzon merolae strain 10D]
MGRLVRQGSGMLCSGVAPATTGVEVGTAPPVRVGSVSAQSPRARVLSTLFIPLTGLGLLKVSSFTWVQLRKACDAVEHRTLGCASRASLCGRLVPEPARPPASQAAQPPKRQRPRRTTTGLQCTTSRKPRRGFATNLVRFVQHRILERDWVETLWKVAQRNWWSSAFNSNTSMPGRSLAQNSTDSRSLPVTMTPSQVPSKPMLASSTTSLGRTRTQIRMVPFLQRALPWARHVHVRSRRTSDLLNRIEQRLRTMPLRTVRVDHDPSVAAPNAAVLVLLCRGPEAAETDSCVQVAFVLTERSKLVRIHRGEISCPGGKVRAGDCSLLETALRETQEEIGLDPSFIRILGKFHEYRPLLRSSNFRVLSFIGYLDDRVNPSQLALNRAEVQSLLVVPRGVLEACRSESGNCTWEDTTLGTDLVNEASHAGANTTSEIVGTTARDSPEETGQRQAPLEQFSTEAAPAPMFCLPRELSSGKIVWGMTARIIYDVLALIRECEH